MTGNVWTYSPTPPSLDCFHLDHHGDNLSPQPLSTDPKTAMFVGQDGGQRGGRGRLEEGMLRGERQRGEDIGKKGNDSKKLGIERVKKAEFTANSKRTRDVFTSRGMSFPLISCNRTSGIRRGGCSRQSQWEQQTFPHPAEWTLWYER